LALNQKTRDQEESVRLLRKIKNAFNNASELKCGACQKSFVPVLFKVHVQNCKQLLK